MKPWWPSKLRQQLPQSIQFTQGGEIWNILNICKCEIRKYQIKEGKLATRSVEQLIGKDKKSHTSPEAFILPSCVEIVKSMFGNKNKGNRKCATFK